MSDIDWDEALDEGQGNTQQLRDGGVRSVLGQTLTDAEWERTSIRINEGRYRLIKPGTALYENLAGPIRAYWRAKREANAIMQTPKWKSFMKEFLFILRMLFSLAFLCGILLGMDYVNKSLTEEASASTNKPTYTTSRRR